jgi:O-antigen ligase
MLGFIGALVFAVIANFMTRPAEGTRPVSIAGRQQKIAAGAGAVALIFLIFGIVLFLGADTSLMRSIGMGGGDDVSNGRSHFWPIAIRIFLDHPLVGAGLDAFGSAFTKYDTWPGFYRVEQAHNDYLQTLADAGIVGFACVTAFIYFLFRKGLTTVTLSVDPFRRSAAVGALAGCFGILIHSFFDFPLRTPSNAFFFLMLTAIAVVHIKPRHD